MKKTIILLLVCVATVLASCNKETESEFTTDYAGKWYSESMLNCDQTQLWEIDVDANAEYRSSAGSQGSGHVSGTAFVSGTTLTVNRRTYSIDETPVRVGNVGYFWRMKLDGVFYYSDKEGTVGSTRRTCGQASYSLINNTGNKINAVINGVPTTILNNTIFELGDDNFLGTFEYTDDHNHEFTYVACFDMIMDLGL